MENKKKNKSNFDIKNLIEKNKRNIIASAVGVVIIATAGFAYTLSVKNKVAEWESKIYPEVSVYGVEIGGLTKEEAVQKLTSDLPGVIMDKKLEVVVGDDKLGLSYSEISPQYNNEAVVTEALNYGKDKGTFSKKRLIKRGADFKIEPSITYNEEALASFEDKVKETVNVAPVDAKLKISGGVKNITPEVIGYGINDEDLHNKLVENINGDPAHEVVLNFELEEKQAKVKSSDLEKIKGVMGSYYNTYSGGGGRVRNMEIATEDVNGIVLMPGEIFSYNEVVGDTTPDKGYQKANTYVAGEIVEDYGGGICQVSTALYRAVMKANIRSYERHNHMMTVSYSQPSLDATVYYGGVDYQFQNPYDFPIYIEGYVSGGKVSFSIWGDPDALGGKTYEMDNEVIETYKPSIRYVDDPTLPEGTEKTKSTGMTGYKSNGYQVTYENGKEVNRELVSTDIYQTTDTVILRGTKKPEVEVEPEPQPEEENETEEPTTES